MGEILYGHYLEDIDNIGVFLTLCVGLEVWVSTNYNFKRYPLHQLPRVAEGIYMDNLKGIYMWWFYYNQREYKITLIRVLFGSR